MRASLDYLIAKVQVMTAGLRPPLLDNLGLAAAIEWQLREFKRRSGLDCRLVAPEVVAPLDGQVATAVMRIFLEALTNTLRHAQATQVHVTLCCSAETLELEVFDNGSGITAEDIGSATAYGVMGMQERARLCHGELEITGRPGKGTTVYLTVPLAGREDGATQP
jgi:two-component system, NarL family, sensor histidine kinase UhpB